METVLEVLFSYLPVEAAIAIFMVIGGIILSKNVIEKRIGYAFNPKSQLREQIDEIQKDIQLLNDPEIKKYLIYKYEKLVVEYHYDIGKPLEVSKKWLEFSEAGGRKDGFKLAALAITKLYLNIDELTGKPKIKVESLHYILLSLNVITTLVALPIASILIVATIVTILSGSWLGIIAALFSVLAYYVVWKSTNEIFDFIYMQFVSHKKLARLLMEDTVLEQQQNKIAVANDDISSSEQNSENQ